MYFIYGYKFHRAIFIILLILILFTLTACDLSDSNNLTEAPPLNTAKMAEETRSISTELSGSNPALPNQELKVLDYLAPIKLVGLGLSSYGTAEVFRMSWRITQYLVENHSFKGVIIECDFGQSLYMDRYVTSGEGNPSHFLHTQLDLWPWKCQEIIAFLNWMRDYNKGKEEQDKIHVFGFYSHSLNPGAHFLQEYLDTIPGDLGEEAVPILTEAMNLDLFCYENMLITEKDRIEEKFQYIYNKLENRTQELRQFSGEFEFEKALHLSRSLLQAHKLFCLHGVSGTQDKVYQLENVLACHGLMGNPGKSVLWGHVSSLFRSGKTYNLGLQLGKIMQEDYQVLGVMFSLGGYNAIRTNAAGNLFDLGPFYIDSVTLKSSVNYIWHEMGMDCFTFKVSDIPADSELKSWLTLINRYFFVTGLTTQTQFNTSNYKQYDLLRSIDAIVYVDYSEPTSLLF